MVQARDALVGWSVARSPIVGPPSARPGELPCPDIDNSGTDAGGCAAGAIGRVPWRSLGIAEPKDGAGETLWYTIAGPFRNYSQNNDPITSDTLGNLTVYLNTSGTTLTNQAIAVIFAPGTILGMQDRSPTATALCTTTATTIARNLCAANYLEATGGGNNAQTAGPFIQASSSPTFNDRLLILTNADLMPAVEQRVARDMIGYLNSYRCHDGGVYPWASRGTPGDSNGNEFVFATSHNRFPCGIAKPQNWGTGGTPNLPAYLTNRCPTLTGWAGVFYYSVARDRLENGGKGCRM